ncbi:MAG: MFS transporter [Actinobacteria bacterium]|nr:MFS transporter [Actinomycetota bacterium]
MSARNRLQRLTGGAAAGPLLVLFGLNLVDEFDRFAFAALSPEIRDAFDLTDTGIGAISVVAGAFILVAALPIGVVADRANRVRIATGAAILWGSMSVLTGLVPTVALLFLVRLLGGIGRIVNEVVHPSLLNDYYDQRVLPRVFFLHRLANPLSGLAGVVAGVIAASLGWEWAFFLLAIPTFVLIGAVVRLREPARGETIDPALAEEAAAEGAIAFGEARRQLWGVPTLRRLWTASLLLGLAIISIPPLLALFYEQEYGYASVGRGAVVFLWSTGVVVGLILGLRYADRAEAEGHTSALATITGLSGVWLAAGLVVMAVAPWSAVSLLAMAIGAFGAGSFQPAYFPLVGRVAPPRVRSQAYAWAILFLAAGALASVALFAIGDAQGYRTAFTVLAVDVALAGLIARSARSLVAADVGQAEGALVVAAELRRTLEATGTPALLSCRNVGVAYDQIQVLFGVDLEVQHGEIVALLGTNGAGKSTLLRAISGLTDPNHGAIFFDGRDVTHADANRTTELGIVQVPGGRAVFPTLTVAEHLRLAAWQHRDEPAYVEDATAEVLELFPILRERSGQIAGNLSGGEQQMLGLAMAFIQRPKLLLIDELSLGLAPAIVEELLGVVRRIRDEGTAIVIVEQSVNVALTISDRAYFMEKGEIRFEGPAAELIERDDIVRSVFLAGARVTTAGNGDGDQARVRLDPDATTEIVGTSDGAALGVFDLTRTFGGIRAVDGATLTVGRGEILGIIGPNGAGKTTLFDVISGFLRPDEGRVVFGERDITDLSPHKRARLGLGRSFQDARLAPSLTVAENLALGLERHLVHRDHVAAAFGLPGAADQEIDVAWSVHDLVELLGLGAYRNKFVRELSTGTRRIVDLGMVMAHDPEVLLLDEPSSGIAQREAEALVPLLKRLRDEVGCALLVIEHDMSLITSLSDRMIAMELGRLIAEGSPAEVTTDERVVASYLGGNLAAIRRSGKEA